MDIYRIQDTAIDIHEVLGALADPASGGLSLFLGTVRSEFEGRPSLGLFYEAYVPLAESEMARITLELRDRYQVRRLVMIHRVGELGLSEVAVVIGASSPHRPEAIAAVRDGIDMVKARVPIWKKERWADGGDAWHHDDRAGLS